MPSLSDHIPRVWWPRISPWPHSHQAPESFSYVWPQLIKTWIDSMECFQQLKSPSLRRSFPPPPLRVPMRERSQQQKNLLFVPAQIWTLRRPQPLWQGLGGGWVGAWHVSHTFPPGSGPEEEFPLSPSVNVQHGPAVLRRDGQGALELCLGEGAVG